MKLITNNPKFINNNFKDIEVNYLDVTYLEILEEVRDYIHNNWELLTHPLYGSVKPNETVYRSVIIKKNKKLDIMSESLISEAIVTFEKFQAGRRVPNWTETIREDFSVIDYDLILNTIKRII